MRLRIDHFAKIKNADIWIDGITIIAGENNTGKSTIGKILYTVFNALYDLEVKIENKRKEEIYEICSRYIRNGGMREQILHSKNSSNFGVFRRIAEPMLEELTEKIIESEDDLFDLELYKELLCEIFAKYEVSCEEETMREFIDITFDKIATRKQNDSHKIGKELIQRYFMQVFSSQIQCLKTPETGAQILLTIKDKEISLRFRQNECISWSADYHILHEAFFLDDPFVLDDLSDYYYSEMASKGIRRELQGKISKAQNDIMEGLFDAVNAKEGLKDIYAILNKVIEGDILLQKGQWELDTGKLEESINFENLSAGLKSFVLIKILLEKGILKEKDVLILDEPEIHLHPEWQLFYAEIIVLLQKKFDLSIVVTTHSMNFLEAIEFYSKKYELDHKCKYYLTNMQDGLATFEDVTNSLDKIYKQMVTPSRLLDQLKYEMEKEDD